MNYVAAALSLAIVAGVVMVTTNLALDSIAELQAVREQVISKYRRE